MAFRRARQLAAFIIPNKLQCGGICFLFAGFSYNGTFTDLSHYFLAPSASLSSPLKRRFPFNPLIPT